MNTFGLFKKSIIEKTPTFFLVKNTLYENKKYLSLEIVASFLRASSELITIAIIYLAIKVITSDEPVEDFFSQISLLDFFPFVVDPNPSTLSSSTQYTSFCVVRSYHSFPIIPWTEGVVPVEMEACPGPVRVW